MNVSISRPAVSAFTPCTSPDGTIYAAALLDRLGDPVDRHLERALGDVARLPVRMRMQRADRALLEHELDQHQVGQVEDHAAGRAVELDHLALAGLCEDFGS